MGFVIDYKQATIQSIYDCSMITTSVMLTKEIERSRSSFPLEKGQYSFWERQGAFLLNSKSFMSNFGNISFDQYQCLFAF
jgi:hypothetical protein